MELDIAAWLGLGVRWLHMIAGIAWIGASFYFVWLDNHLRPTAKGGADGVTGEVWSVHGGGFYHKQKYAVAPAHMPDDLHWFKWEAYTTWLSGMALLGIVYYWGADLFLVDSAKAALSPVQAVLLGLGVIAGGWLVYDGLCRSPLGRNGRLFGALWFLVLVALSYGLVQVFNDRGAFIHVGAVIGTAMVANVFFVIIPNQKKVVAALERGEEPDPALGAAGKQRSLHNNYMTLPVLFIMISNHYPMVFSHPYNWLLLAAIGVLGVMIRHFFNLRHREVSAPGLVFASIGLFIIIAMFTAQTRSAGRPDMAGGVAGAVPFTEVRAIMETHCTSCHATNPRHPAFTEAPGGVRLDSPALIRQYAPKIEQQAVLANIMPLGNETGMTDGERARLGKWIADHRKDGS
ncbi:urate hydroxylase PuuD [Yunchengibacter salinarum]|uniref:urate hydroxylase PuuD n=1 Tax=Yunchengibacter salinarum TaxID=3133399 RepID=UPI0035B6A22C